MILSADTNLFVYAVDDRDPVKRETARTVIAQLARAQAPISLQVIGELQNALRRRLKMPVHLASQQARNIFSAFPSFAYDRTSVDQALAQSAAARLGYWDALLIAACSQAGVSVLLSEDMQDGFTLGGVRVINPFGADGLSIAARQILES